MTRSLLLTIVLVAALATAASPASAAAFPESIPLPDGFYPEGIEVGVGHDFYVGSLLDGAVYKGDLRSGAGSVLVDGVAGRLVAGLAFDRRSGLLWAAGAEGTGTRVFAFDGGSGDLVHDVPIDGALLNDLVVTRDALYVTDSFAPVLWTVPLSRRGAPAGPPVAMELSGDFTFVTEGDPFPVNLNGIAATADGTALIAVHSLLGVLYRIDPATAEATQIELGDRFAPAADGIRLRGRTLYVVQNFSNRVSVVRLSPDLASGDIVATITSDLFRVPATGALFGGSLYVVNARFDEGLPPPFSDEIRTLDYDVVKVPAR